jgi:hypothetical protein
MKITKRQLRRVIKEEKAKLQKEGAPANPGQALGALHSAIDDLIKVLGNEEAYLELLGIVEEWQ